MDADKHPDECSSQDRDPVPEFDGDDAGRSLEFVLLSDVRVWRMVRLGLRLTQFGIIAGVVSVMPAILQLVDILSSKQPTDLANIIAGIAFLGTFLAAILAYYGGRYCCCAVPVELSVRGYAVWSVGCMTLLPFTVAGFLFLWRPPSTEPHPLGPQPPDGRDVLLLMAGLAVLIIHSVGHLSFILFLRGVGRFLRWASLSKHTTTYIVSFGLVATGLAAAGCTIFLFPQAHEVGVNLIFVVAVSGFALFVSFVLMISQLHDALADALRRADD